ncbi:MalY/PatB family protein [Candidatus Lokiarchaeum ossiferum]
MMLDKKDWNFDQIIDRMQTNSIKWDPIFLKFQFGEKNQDILPLWVADMDFESPSVVKKAMIERAQHQIYGYTFTGLSYFEALKSWYNRRHDWEIERDWVCTTPGIVPAINFIIQRFSKPGDKIVIQTPVYYPFSEAILNNGRQLVENSLLLEEGQYRMNFEDLESKLKDSRVKIVILCNPHNPVGRVWTKEELTRFGNICIENGVLILSDEIHCDLIMPKFKHVCFASISEKFAMNSITCNAGSKTFNLAGLKQSNVIIPNKRMLAEFRNHLNNLGLMGGTLFGAVSLEAAYNGAEAWLDDLILYLAENFKFLKQYLEKNLPGVSAIELQGTYLVWVDFRNLRLDAKELKRIMEEEAKIGLDDGAMFGDVGAGFQRVNIACPKSILKKALDNIIHAFKPYIS